MDCRFVWLAIAVALAGCTPPVVQPVIEIIQPAGSSAGGQNALGQAPVIANIRLPSSRFGAEEVFEVMYDVTVAGSGFFAKYGLKTSQGSQVFPIAQPIPVINFGHVDMPTIGPLPNLTKGGLQDAEFWVVDSAGQESNHLAFTTTIQ